MSQVELRAALEAAFGIVIDDPASEHIRTLGDLCEYLKRRAGRTAGCNCPTARCFYRLRRAVFTQVPLPRSKFKPEIELAALFPKVSRRRSWKRLGKALGARLPGLRWPILIRSGFAVSCVGMPLAICVTVLVLASNETPKNDGPILGLLLAGLMSPLLLVFLGLFMQPLAIAVAADVATAGGLSRYLVRTDFLPTPLVGEDLDAWIWETVREAVSKVDCTERSEPQRDWHFDVELSED